MYCVFRLCQINYYHTIPYHMSPGILFVLIIITTCWLCSSLPLFVRKSFPSTDPSTAVSKIVIQ